MPRFSLVFLQLAGILGLLLSSPALSGAQGLRASEKERKPLTIGFLQDGKSDKLEYLRKQFQEEVQVLMAKEYKLRFVQDSSRIPFDSLAIHQAFRRLQDNPQVDLIIGVGPLVSEIMAVNGPYSKPVIASTVFAYALKPHLPLTSRHTSGVKNLTYFDNLIDPLRDLDILFEIKNFKKLTILVEPSLLKVWPSMIHLENYFKEKEATYELIAAAPRAKANLERLPEDTDVVYLATLVEMDSLEFHRLLEGLMKKKLPTYAMFGKADVESGALAGVFAASNYDRLSMEVANSVETIVGGKPPEEMVVDLLSYRENLYINSETARWINYYPDWKILKDAVLIPAEGLSASRSLDLKKAVIEGLKYNLDARIARQQVYFGLYLIRETLASLLPNLYLLPALSWAELDDDNALIGENPQFWGILGGTFSQMIWDETAVAAYDIEKHLQVSRLQEKRLVELDVGLEAARAYLEVLKANLIESVQTRRLKFIRQNLAYARQRESRNSQLRSEVNRWKAERSFGRSDLLEAKVRRRNAELFMNRYLVRPISEFFVAEDSRMEELDFIYTDERIKPLWDDPVHFEKFADFLVLEARRYLPEIKQVRAQIAARQREVKLRQRRFYLPRFYLEGGFYYRFMTQGEGVLLDVYGIRNMPMGPMEADFSYIIGLRAEYPLFIGNRRMARYQKARINRDILLNKEENILLDAELDIRQQLQRLRVAYANIRFYQRAEEEAFINLYEMQQAYQQEQVRIVRLLDAQKTAIDARVASVLATYEFIEQIIILERRLGFYSFLYTPLEKEIFIQRLQTFLKSKSKND